MPNRAIVVMLLTLLPVGPTSAGDAAFSNQVVKGIVEFRAGYEEWDLARFTAARDIFRAASSNDATSYTAHYWQGAREFHMVLWHRDEGRANASRENARELMDAAMITLQKAVKLNPADGECRAMLGTLLGMKIAAAPLSALTRGRRVMSYGDKALENEPDNPRVEYLLGCSYLNSAGLLGGGAGKALQSFQRAETLFEKEAELPASPLDPRWGLRSCLAFAGKACSELGRREEAIQYFNRVLQMNPDNGLATKGLAEMEEKREKNE